jgi:hypothetical protein
MHHHRTCAAPAALALAAALAGCSPSAPPEEREAVGPRAVTAPADYVHVGFQAGEKAKATLGLMTLNKAISQYRIEHGSNPSSLEQLRAGGYVPEIPPAPAGQRYRYDPRSGQVSLEAK